MPIKYPCLFCKKSVRANQHAFQCERCQGWQHVGCNSGFSHQQYLEIRDDPSRLDVWICAPCTSQDQEQEEDPMDIEENGDVPTDDGGFNVETDFDVPLEVAENPLPDAALPAVIPGLGDEDITIYKTVESGTKRGKVILVDSHGYTYTKKWKKAGSTSSKVTWLCSVRGKLHRCAVSVHQDGNLFHAGLHTKHTHPAHPGADVAVQVKALVITKAKADIFKSAGAIVEDVITTLTHPLQVVLIQPTCPGLQTVTARASALPSHETLTL
ncbi:uncharacterized protein LOC119727838 [Patiria miniata]|uniref:PHD-type domain-containing protein n=1 Tax=Patiria miniata TaxID=46514 RepID=A0A913ZWE1_PATMI|nr:uncharacterized protein LOC119727838 [Patiria miniata]